MRSLVTRLRNFIGNASGYHSLILVSKLSIQNYSCVSQGPISEATCRVLKVKYSCVQWELRTDSQLNKARENCTPLGLECHGDVIKWKCFLCFWPIVRGIHRSPVDFPHKGQWSWTLMSSRICAWTDGWANNRNAGDLRRCRAHYDVIVMVFLVCDLNRTPNCYGKTWRFLCPFFRNLHLRENLARDCFTSTVSTVTNSVQNIFTHLRYCDK